MRVGKVVPRLLMIIAGVSIASSASFQSKSGNTQRAAGENQISTNKGLLSDSSAERLAAKTRLEDQRKKEISDLIEIISRRSEAITGVTYFKADDPLYLAVELLGEYRSVEAVPLLVRLKGRLALEGADYRRRREFVPIIESFFAAKALINIGYPSLDAIFNELRSAGKMDIMEVQLGAVILIEIQGKAVTRFMLEDARKAQLPDVAFQKLEVALQAIETYDRRKWVFNGQKFGPEEEFLKLKRP